MQAWVHIGVNIFYHLRDGDTTGQHFQRLQHLLLTHHAMGDVLCEFGLRIPDDRTMGGNDLNDIYRLQTLERVEVILHVPVRRGDDDRAHTRDEISGKEDSCLFKQVAEMVEAMAGGVDST